MNLDALGVDLTRAEGAVDELSLVVQVWGVNGPASVSLRCEPTHSSPPCLPSFLQTLSKDWKLAREMVERAVRELADPTRGRGGGTLVRAGARIEAATFGYGGAAPGGGAGGAAECDDDIVTAMDAMSEVHQGHLLVQV